MFSVLETLGEELHLGLLGRRSRLLELALQLADVEPREGVSFLKLLA